MLTCCCCCSGGACSMRAFCESDMFAKVVSTTWSKPIFLSTVATKVQENIAMIMNGSHQLLSRFKSVKVLLGAKNTLVTRSICESGAPCSGTGVTAVLMMLSSCGWVRVPKTTWCMRLDYEPTLRKLHSTELLCSHSTL